MTHSPYEVVRYGGDRDRDAVLDLQAMHWGPDRALNERHFAWKYEQNPWLATPHVYFVYRQGGPVGMRGFFGSRWEVGSPPEAMIIPCAADLVIAPECRDRGVYTQLMRYALADLVHRHKAPYLFNLSSGPATRLGARSMGWGEIGPLEQVLWERPRDGDGDPLAWVDTLLAAGDTEVSPGIVLSAEPRPREMAQVVRRSGYDGRLRHVRDETFFTWRYRQPTARFRFLYLSREGEEIGGYLVLRAKMPGTPGPILIIDCESDEAGAAALLSAALRRCRLSQVVAWRSSIAAVRSDALARLGMTTIEVRSVADSYAAVLVLPNAAPLVPKPWMAGNRDILDPLSWDLRQAYSDGG
jgi:hypothetical protein